MREWDFLHSPESVLAASFNSLYLDSTSMPLAEEKTMPLPNMGSSCNKVPGQLVTQNDFQEE